MKKLDIKEVMEVCESCLGKIQKQSENNYSICNEYYNEEFCECCGKKVKHLIEIATVDFIENNGIVNGDELTVNNEITNS